MKWLRVYVDTSVIGGCFDKEFALWSNGLMADFRLRRFRPVVSEVTSAEMQMAPMQVRVLYEEILALAEYLPLTEDALALLEEYERHAILGSRFRNDMLHIALATVGQVDILVSWNYKHIVRFDKIQGFNGINLECGYKPLGIYSPREVTTYEREN